MPQNVCRSPRSGARSQQIQASPRAMLGSCWLAQLLPFGPQNGFTVVSAGPRDNGTYVLGQRNNVLNFQHVLGFCRGRMATKKRFQPRAATTFEKTFAIWLPMVRRTTITTIDTSTRMRAYSTIP